MWYSSINVEANHLFLRICMDKIYSLKFSPNVGLLRMNCDCATNLATKVKEIMLHFTNQRECGTINVLCNNKLTSYWA